MDVLTLSPPSGEEFWTSIEDEVVGCLRDHGAMAPAELGRRLRISAGAATSLIAMLAAEGRVRICSVELIGNGERA